METPRLPSENQPLELRASKIGGCVRAYVIDLREGAPPMNERSRIACLVGKALEPVIMQAAHLDPALLLGDKLEVRVPVGRGIVITGHPDAFDEGWVIECKTMRTKYYQNVVNRSLFAEFPQYLIQGAVYARGLDARGVKYLCFDKDASVVFKVTVEAWELADYWSQAEANARKIAEWVGNKTLPGKDADLPYHCCLPEYCPRHHCRFNHIHSRLRRQAKS